VIGAIGEREVLATLPLEGYPGVDQVLPILKPYKLVAREVAPDPTLIEVNGRKIGQDYFGLIAGPCSVEYREQTLEAARAVAAAGGTMLRGGAFKPRTSPYTFQGLGDEALAILREAREETGLPVVTELMDPRPRRGRPRLGGRDSDRRAQQSELPAPGGGRAGRQAGLVEARPLLVGRGAADGGRVRGQGGERADHPLRARDQDVRDLDALHAGSRRRRGAEAGDAPAR
jgi:hypothetical protein